MNLGQKEIKKLPSYGVAKIKFGILIVGLVSAQLEKEIIGDFHHLLTIWTSQLLLTHQINHTASQDGLPCVKKSGLNYANRRPTHWREKLERIKKRVRK